MGVHAAALLAHAFASLVNREKPKTQLPGDRAFEVARAAGCASLPPPPKIAP